MVRNLGFLIVLAGLAPASSAGAEPLSDFGTHGQLIFSADRLSPVLSYARIRQDQPGGDTTTNSSTSLSLLWTGNPTDFYDIPRAGLDYVMAPNLTVGGTLFATLPMSSTRATTQNGVTTSRDGTKLTAVGIGARGGYVIPLTPRVSFWGRAGLSYTRESTSTTQGNQNPTTQTVSVSQFALNLEPLFVIEVTHHVGVQIGPVLDVPLSGNQHTEETQQAMTVSTDTNSSQLHLGITAGLLGYL